jgi:hypothetical protein
MDAALAAALAAPTPLPRAAAFVPVLHMIREEGADDEAVVAHSVAQAAVAVAGGADALAVIPGAAGLGVALVARAAAAVRLAHPATPLIVNFMCPPAQALHSVPAFAHLWTDKGVDARGVHADVAAGLLFVQ